MMKRFTGLLLGLLLAVQAYAQDPQFSQILSSPLTLNPSYAGTSEQQRFSLISRIQWPSAPNAFVTHAFSYDWNVPQLNSGFGFLATADKAGTVNLRTTAMNLVYAYKIQLKKKWVISPSVMFGYTFRNVDRSKFLFGDQFDFADPDNSISGDSSLGLIDPSVGFFDFASGLLVYNQNVWFGASFYHMNEPNQSFLGESDPLNMKLLIHGGLLLQIDQGLFRTARIPTLSPQFIYSRQGLFDQLSIGTMFYYNPIQLGLWYRGIPLFDEVLANTSSQDAISIMFGLRFKKLAIGYNYDVTVSRLGPSSGGTHEISIVWQFAYYKGNSSANRKPIPCPSFSESILDTFKY